MNKLLNCFYLLLDVFFPSICFICEQKIVRGHFFCHKCLGDFDNEFSGCDLCFRKNVSKGKHLCSKCREKTDVERVISPFVYRDQLKRIIHLFKYRGFYFLAPVLAGRMVLLLNHLGFSAENFDFVTFVPMSGMRLRKRGYNQSQLLAKEISSSFGLDCKDVLTVSRVKESQVSLDLKNRLENPIGCFSLKSDFSQGANILLIDDVFTTGTTVFECAKVLKNNRSGKIFIATLAITKNEDHKKLFS